MAAGGCELGGRLRRCARPPANTCQYCARPFCQDHAHLLEGYEAVCARKPCVAKQDDLRAHLGHMRGVRLRNREGRCGVEGCANAHGFDCEKCGARFCLGHLADRLYPAAPNSGEAAAMACVCAHCWGRREIWSRA